MTLDSVKNTSPGIDLIAYKLIKSLNRNNLEKTLDIMNEIFATGSLPDTWKTGRVIPTCYSGKSSNEVTSYRLNTLLPCLGELMKEIIQKRLEFHIERIQGLSHS